MLNSTASYLALRAPESFARLCKTCRVALFDGPVATPFAKSTDPKVDLITVNWKALATRIVNDLAAPRFQLSTQPFVFEAEALCRTPWNSSSNNDLAVMPDR